MATTKDQIIQELREQNARMQDQLTAFMSMMANQAPQKASVSVNQMSVGVKNISNLTIGLPGNGTKVALESPTPNEPDVQLPPAKDAHDFSNRAIISYAWWRKLCQSELYKKGLIVRDDTALGPVDVPAPADDPATLPKEALVNQVFDPTAFIEGNSEAELRQKIERMTSEASLRRLQYCVDLKVNELRGLMGCDGSTTPENAKKEKAAVMALPSVYGLVERLVEERLIEMTTKYVE